MNDLELYREQLALCDDKIIDALVERGAIVEKIMSYKEEYGMPILQPQQEEKQKRRLEEKLTDNKYKEEIYDIFRCILKNSKRVQARKLFDYNIVLIGFMGAGKSTVSDYLSTMFAMDIVEMDQEISEREEMSIPDIFETYGEEYFRNLETELLVEHLKLLRQGKAIDCPVYDYSQHNRSDKILHITPSPVILVEGILLLADPRVRELLDIKVYVEADADERILRRISRDVEERGRDLNGIINQYLNTVKPMHYLYVEPTRSKADIVINSGKNDVAFDLFVSKISMELEKRKQG